MVLAEALSIKPSPCFLRRLSTATLLMMSFDVFSRNGTILPQSDAVIPLSNIEYAYGFGVYESIRAVRGTALFLEDHLKRLLHSASILELEHSLTIGEIAEWIIALLARTESEACNLKILLIGGKDAASAQLFIIPLAPLFPDKRLYTKGATAITRTYERTLPHAKSLNMLGSYLAYRDAKRAGAYDALLVNRHGCITEGTRTNFFVMKDETIISPPREDILEGVTMMHVLEAATQCGYSVDYQQLPLANVGSFDTAFLTSTSSKIMPLSHIDDVAFTISPQLKTLMTTFDEMLKSC